MVEGLPFTTNPPFKLNEMFVWSVDNTTSVSNRKNNTPWIFIWYSLWLFIWSSLKRTTTPKNLPTFYPLSLYLNCFLQQCWETLNHDKKLIVYLLNTLIQLNYTKVTSLMTHRTRTILYPEKIFIRVETKKINENESKYNWVEV